MTNYDAIVGDSFWDEVNKTFLCDSLTRISGHHIPPGPQSRRLLLKRKHGTWNPEAINIISMRRRRKKSYGKSSEFFYIICSLSRFGRYLIVSLTVSVLINRRFIRSYSYDNKAIISRNFRKEVGGNRFLAALLYSPGNLHASRSKTRWYHKFIFWSYQMKLGRQTFWKKRFEIPTFQLLPLSFIFSISKTFTALLVQSLHMSKTTPPFTHKKCFAVSRFWHN